MVSLLSNPLATPDQLLSIPSDADSVPIALRTSLLWGAGTLIQSTGVILRLPQTTIATAIILLQRYYLLRSLRSSALIDTAHGSLYLSCKLTEQAKKPRSIINATTYLLRCPSSTSPISPAPKDDNAPTNPDVYYVSEHEYFALRTRLLEAEADILKALGFQTWCSLPYTLVLNYAQPLNCLEKGILLKAVGYLNDALVAPSLVYLTHQPHQLAVAALYLAARVDADGDGKQAAEGGVKLPEGWWEIFDVEREELGFLVAAMKGAGKYIEEETARWKKPGGKGIPWDLKALEEEMQFY